MIKMTEESLKLLNEHLNPDGTFRIDESLPEHIRNAMQYFNDSGMKATDIINRSASDLSVPLEEEPNEEDVSEDETILDENAVSVEPSSEMEENLTSNSVPPINNQLTAEKQAEIAQNLEDLNDIF